MKVLALALLLLPFLASFLRHFGPPETGEADGPCESVSSIISRQMFEEMLKHRGDLRCPGSFYTYDAFIAAAEVFPGFGRTGTLDICRRELAAFFGQTSHETRGGWSGAPDGKYSWGYCWIEQLSPPSIYCNTTYVKYPCTAGKRYHGRGPIQLTWNFNYGRAGQYLGLDLLNDPDTVKKNATIAFMTAMWFWMTTQPPRPSCHDVITGQWIPSSNDTAAGRLPGFGVITNIVNRGECGHGYDSRAASRIGFYERYCHILGTDMGNNLDCYNQEPFGWEYVDPIPAQPML
ncbi:endochitinase-like [Phalaenopsis equestris]|uniref:endochitinase-like n=1 Tax=Phalaenopsis equestris TaxID=78828 RepID=UPI0009E54CE1|nr:endochitinase-like [Phalaenopsis equestris]